MPGLRYGPDITDDAEIMRRSISDLGKRLKSIQGRGGSGEATRRRIEELKRAARARFGNLKNMNEAARYSLRRQGYQQGAPRKTVGGVRLRARPALPADLQNRLRANRRNVETPRGGLKSNRQIQKDAQKAKKAKKAAKAKRAKKSPAKKTAKRARR